MFEVIKRKYANMMDIMTYDDLLRRLKRIIASLRARTWTASIDVTASGPHREYLGEF